jgi:MFS family permease
MAKFAGLSTIARTLGIANYRTYTAGNFVSQLGMWVQRVAVGWLTWTLTEDPKWLGIIAFADFFPNFIVAPLAGALADRLDRLKAIRIYMALSGTVSAIIAGLTIADLITIESLLVLVLINGTVMSFSYPVRLSMIHALVGREALTSAVGINALVFNIARITGPAFAGLMIKFFGIGVAVSFTVVADFIFVFSLYFVHLVETAKKQEHRPAREIPGEIMEGFSYARNHPGIGPLLFILACTSILGRPFSDLFPAFSDDIFGLGSDGLAYLTSMLGVGAVVGSVVMALREGIEGLTKLLIAAIVILAISVIGFAATDIFWFAMFCVAIAGFAVTLIGVSEQTLLQSSVDGAMRGRVLSLYTLIARGCPSFGALLMGYLASWGGLQLPVAGGAVLCIGLWIWARARQARLAESLEVSPDRERAEAPFAGS